MIHLLNILVSNLVTQLVKDWVRNLMKNLVVHLVMCSSFDGDDGVWCVVVVVMVMLDQMIRFLEF